MRKFYYRKLCQIFSIFFFFFSKPVNIYFRIDALSGITTFLNTLHFSPLLFPGILLVLLIFLFGNFFCFWICPVGGIIDLVNIILFRKKWKLGISCPVFLNRVRFYLLGIIIYLSLIKAPYLTWIFNPFVILERAFVLKKFWLLYFFLILTISIIFPRFWCRNICPVGCLYHIIGKRRVFKK
ncbi:MAG: hypothetical protein DRP67_05520 [Candidatus Omnitrophota bacterium]|nr:MAG: hypothetical protein DRP67_05520 [Candidatus Omnitrophota bacterium]